MVTITLQNKSSGNKTFPWTKLVHKWLFFSPSLPQLSWDWNQMNSIWYRTLHRTYSNFWEKNAGFCVQVWRMISRTLTHTLSLFLTHAHPLSLFVTHAHPLSLFSHPHTYPLSSHTRTLSLSSHTRSNTLSLFLTLKRPRNVGKNSSHAWIRPKVSFAVHSKPNIQHQLGESTKYFNGFMNVPSDDVEWERIWESEKVRRHLRPNRLNVKSL